MKTDASPATIFHVITAVWGRDFIELFLTTGIPYQLGTGNLAALPEGSRYRILTAAADRARLENANEMRALRARLPVDIVVMDEDPGDATRYRRMIRYHRRAVEDALRCEATLVFLAPDHVLATGTMARLVERRAEGYRAVVCPALRLSKESMLDTLAEYGTHDVPPRTLVRLALQHLHPLTLEHMADAQAFSRHPTSVYWPVTGGGLVARCFSLHPLMIDPVRRQLPRREIDSDYLWRSVPDRALVYVVTDSDDLVVFELSSTRNVVPSGRQMWSKVWRTATVANLCDPHQLTFWHQPIRLHWKDVDASWAAAEMESARFAERVLGWLPLARRVYPFTHRASQWRQRWDRRSREWRRRLPRVRLKQVKRPLVIAVHHTRKRLQRVLR